MSAIRTSAVSSFTVVVLALAVYFAALPNAVRAAKPGAASCSVASYSSLSTQQLRNLLNARSKPLIGKPGAQSCLMAAASSLSTQQLWDMLNARYERRVGLPR